MADRLIVDQNENFIGAENDKLRARGVSCLPLKHRNSIGRFNSSEMLLQSIQAGYELESSSLNPNIHRRKIFLARREVIIAAGTVYTPLFLQRSGLGRFKHLVRVPGLLPLLPAFGKNREHVELGRNLHDHTIMLGMLLGTGLGCPSPWRNSKLKNRDAKSAAITEMLKAITNHRRWVGLTGTRRGIELEEELLVGKQKDGTGKKEEMDPRLFGREEGLETKEQRPAASGMLDRDIEFTIVENCIDEQVYLRIKLWYFHHGPETDGEVGLVSTHPLTPPKIRYRGTRRKQERRKKSTDSDSPTSSGARNSTRVSVRKTSATPAAAASTTTNSNTHIPPRGAHPCQDFVAIERLRLWIKNVFVGKIVPGMQREVNDRATNEKIYGVESFVDGMVTNEEGLLVVAGDSIYTPPTDSTQNGAVSKDNESKESNEMRLHLFSPPTQAVEDSAIFRRFVENVCSDAKHFSGTCRMGKGASTTEESCTSASDLRLKDFSNARVADMSVLYTTHAHTDQLGRTVGRMAAHMIETEREREAVEGPRKSTGRGNIEKGEVRSAGPGAPATTSSDETSDHEQATTTPLVKKVLTLPHIGTGTAGWRGERVTNALGVWFQAKREFQEQNAINKKVAVQMNTSRIKFHIDSAVMYKNMARIHDSLKLSGVARSEVFITTKIHPARHFGYDRTIKAVLEEIADLKSDYIDLVYLHHPGGNHIWEQYRCGTVEEKQKAGDPSWEREWCRPQAVRECEDHDPEVGKTASSSTRRGDHGMGWAACRLQSWKALEYLKSVGRIRHAGVSSFAVWQMQPLVERMNRGASRTSSSGRPLHLLPEDLGGRLLRKAVEEENHRLTEINLRQGRPLSASSESSRSPLSPLPISAHQLEFHPWWRPTCVIEYCRKTGIEIVAYGSLGKGSFVGDHKSEYNPTGLQAPDSVLTDFPQLVHKFQKEPAEFLLKYALQKGVRIIPRSSNPDRIAGNVGMELAVLGQIQENAPDSKDPSAAAHQKQNPGTTGAAHQHDSLNNPAALSDFEIEILDTFYSKDAAMLYSGDEWRRDEPIALEIEKFTGIGKEVDALDKCEAYWGRSFKSNHRPSQSDGKKIGTSDCPTCQERSAQLI
ncbi:unnamed protein product [Amoebophrya sp. A120]|nr:unnamed protein product [Amoebophrya sp. A120]|eukprot:GSA120T00004265001.1